MSTLETFNRRVPYPIRMLLVVLLGFLLYGSAQSAFAVIGKLRGGAPECSWPRTLLFGFDLLRLATWSAFHSVQVRHRAGDASLGIEQFSTNGRAFWIKKAGTSKDGRELLSYLLSD